MMSRMQVSLEPEMQERARERAAELGVSFAEYVRRLLQRDLGEQVAAGDPSLVFDLGRSGGSDVKRDKDSMLGEAVAAM